MLGRGWYLAGAPLSRPAVRRRSFVTGSGSAQTRVVSALMFVLFAMAIMMIVDLDSAQAWAIKVPQKALTDLAAALDKVKLQPDSSQQADSPAD